MGTIAKYVNGNYQVILKKNGTKYRISKDRVLFPIYPETIDMNVSNRCANKCAICYINATPTGKEATLEDLTKIGFLEGIEVAINLNSFMPSEFEQMLAYLHEYGVIANLTVNLLNLKKFHDRLLAWQEMEYIRGIGISLDNGALLETAPTAQLKNVVWHVVNGWHTYELINKLPNTEKILILGYKNKGRAKELYRPSKDTFLSTDNVLRLLNKYQIVSFDNLALEQTDILKELPPEERELRYMGEEGTFSMYIDLVTMTYSRSSTDEKNWPINNMSIRQMFTHIRKIRGTM